MKKKLVMTICVMCALHGMAYEWTEKDDENLKNMFASAFHMPFPPIKEDYELRKKPAVRRFMEQYCPDIDDAEMVGHLTGVIDRCLAKGDTWHPYLMIPSLCILDNPNAVEQLERYLTIASDGEFRKKVLGQGEGIGRKVNEQNLNNFQSKTLRALLPLLNVEQKITLTENIMTNNLYGGGTQAQAIYEYASLYSEETDAVKKERHLNFLRNAASRDDIAGSFGAFDVHLTRLDSSWKLSKQRKRALEKWSVQSEYEGTRNMHSNSLAEIIRFEGEQKKEVSP